MPQTGKPKKVPPFTFTHRLVLYSKGLHGVPAGTQGYVIKQGLETWCCLVQWKTKDGPMICRHAWVGLSLEEVAASVLAT